MEGKDAVPAPPGITPPCFPFCAVFKSSDKIYSCVSKALVFASPVSPPTSLVNSRMSSWKLKLKNPSALNTLDVIHSFACSRFTLFSRYLGWSATCGPSFQTPRAEQHAMGITSLVERTVQQESYFRRTVHGVTCAIAVARSSGRASRG